MLICCCCLGCGNGEKEIDDPDRSDRPDGDEYEDIEVVDGKMKVVKKYRGAFSKVLQDYVRADGRRRAGME